MVAVETILAAQIALLRQLEDEVAKTVSLVEMMASDGLGIDPGLGGRSSVSKRIEDDTACVWGSSIAELAMGKDKAAIIIVKVLIPLRAAK